MNKDQRGRKAVEYLIHFQVQLIKIIFNLCFLWSLFDVFLECSDISF